MESIQKLMESVVSQYPKSSLQEVAAAFSHIELTEEEELEGIIWAKQKKEKILAAKRVKESEERNRKALSSSQWSFSQTDSFMRYRANDIFEGKFILDSNNESIFTMLCYYFSDDQRFESAASFLGSINPSRSKGIMLAGNFGTGKTWMMRLFGKNQRQVYHMRSAKKIANIFEVDGEEVASEFANKITNAANDKESFFQPFAGLCIDDIGTEDIKNHYGNKKNVIGDLIENRYSKGNTGVFLHATTNFTVQQLKDLYGDRVVSRMREIFNLIELNGNDRRK